jgi:ATP/ADP translocase
MSEGAQAAQPPKQSFMKKMKSKIPPANERKKLIPLASMFFFILFNYTILRDTKDVLMVTAKGSGAEVIPFIKTYVNLPAAIGFTALYSKLCDRMEQKDVFYACTIPFLFFFAAFAFIIFPNVGWLHPHAFVDKIAMALPEGFGAPLAIVRNWSYAVFYVMAEMWGSVVASLLFWSFANEVTTVDEAKKYCEFKCDIRSMMCAYQFCIDCYTYAHITSFLSNRSTLWTWSQCCAHLFWSVRSICFWDASELTTRCRPLGNESQIPYGSCRRLGRLPCLYLFVYAKECND